MEEIKELYEEILVLREKGRSLRNQLRDLENKHSEKMDRINSLREKDEKYVWCNTHNKKHHINVINSRKHRIQTIYKKCLFKEDHIWYNTEECAYYIHPEDTDYNNEPLVYVFNRMKCMICNKEIYKQRLWDSPIPYHKMPPVWLEPVLLTGNEERVD